MGLIIDKLAAYVFWYPLLMSLFWIAGSNIFRRRRTAKNEMDFEKADWPMVSILIPCYNEEETIEETIFYMHRLPYPKKEIIAVNDGSHDGTSAILHGLVKKYPDLRIIDCKENRGKATALKLACFASKAEYLICVDSDAVLDDYAIHHLISNFLNKGERLGAVTGNPRIRNRDTLLAKLQIVEYASIIGAIKRAQRITGKIMTVSGVVAAFRKKALVEVGLWDAVIWLTFSSFFLVMLSLVQLISSIIIDSEYDRVYFCFFFGAWYPFIYWILNAVIVIFALPRAIKSRVWGGDAVWTSPDRGARRQSETDSLL